MLRFFTAASAMACALVANACADAPTEPSSTHARPVEARIVPNGAVITGAAALPYVRENFRRRIAGDPAYVAAHARDIPALERALDLPVTAVDVPSFDLVAGAPWWTVKGTSLAFNGTQLVYTAFFAWQASYNVTAARQLLQWQIFDANSGVALQSGSWADGQSGGVTSMQTLYYPSASGECVYATGNTIHSITYSSWGFTTGASTSSSDQTPPTACPSSTPPDAGCGAFSTAFVYDPSAEIAPAPCGGPGGSDLGSGSNCQVEYIYIDQLTSNGWTEVWEGYATVCS